MKINNDTIARMTRLLRDEENAQLHVAPWQRNRRRFRVPAWLVALPAAAIVGFFFGLWTNSNSPADSPLTALVDTVYVTVEKPATPKDTATSMSDSRPSAQSDLQPISRPTESTHRHKSVRSSQPTSTLTAGRSIADDRIRYDLLVRN